MVLVIYWYITYNLRNIEVHFRGMCLLFSPYLYDIFIKYKVQKVPKSGFRTWRYYDFCCGFYFRYFH